MSHVSPQTEAAERSHILLVSPSSEGAATEAIEKKINEDGVLKKIFQCTTLQSELAIAAHEEYHSLRRSESTQKSKKPKYQEAADDVKECVESIHSTVEKILSSRREMLDARRAIQHMGMNVDETSAAMQDQTFNS